MPTQLGSIDQYITDKRQFDLSSLASLFGGASTSAPSSGATGGFDFGSLASLFGGGKSSSAPSLGGFDFSSIASLFGGKSSSAPAPTAGLFDGLTGIATSFVNTALRTITMKAVSIETLQPQVRKGAKRVKVKYGPFKIKGSKTKVNAVSHVRLS
jgi:hypothetical protein